MKCVPWSQVGAGPNFQGRVCTYLSAAAVLTADHLPVPSWLPAHERHFQACG